MYETLIADIKSFDPNLLLGAVAGVAILTGLFYLLQGILGTFFGWLGKAFSKLFFYKLTVHYSSDSYPKFNYWFQQHQPKSKMVREFKTHKVGKKDRLIQGFGTFYLKVKGIPLLIVSRDRIEKKNAREETDVINIIALTFRKKGLDKLFDAVDKVDMDTVDFIPSVFYNEEGWWSEVGDVRPVLTPPMGVADEFIYDVELFNSNKELFKKRKLPFKRGYLFYGSAGTGKTSLVLYAATKFGMNIYITEKPIDNDMMGQIKPNSIILIEDIDLSAMSGNRKLEDKPITFTKTKTHFSLDEIIPLGSDVVNERGDIVEPEDKKPDDEMDATGAENLHKMLQMLDGITTYDNCIFICTTNNIDALDTALIRAGRIDRKYHVGVLTPDEQLKYYNTFYEQSAKTINSTGEMTMAELSDIFLTNISDNIVSKEKLLIVD